MVVNTEKMAFSPLETANVLGLSLNATYQYIREGVIPHCRIGRRILVPRRELEALLASGIPDGNKRENIEVV